MIILLFPDRLAELHVRLLQLFQRTAHHILRTFHGILAVFACGTHDLLRTLLGSRYQLSGFLSGLLGDLMLIDLLFGVVIRLLFQIIIFFFEASL